MKNLVVFCDGTWNTPSETENVAKLYNAILRSDDQLAYYHPGVGTGKGWWDHLAGGGTGAGLDQNIMSGYHWLALRYTPGDNIFLFGFSRGAYTVRSLGGLIAKCGLLDLTTLDPQTVWQRVQEVFDAYRGNVAFTNPKKFPFHNTAAGTNSKESVPIHFIGVWDTVGALGIPDDFALLGLLDDPDRYRFHDTTLSPIVKHARHALALDEKRASFAPTLWTGCDDQRPEAKQIWFPGVHSDVGGGYLETGLSDGALAWMMDEATACGLQLRPGARDQLKPDPLGIVHDSYAGVFKLLKSKPRSVPRIGNGPVSHLHQSTLTRHADPPITQGEYWKTTLLKSGDPQTIDIYAREHWNFTGLFLEQDVQYEFVASGEWLDGATAFRPTGDEVGRSHSGDIGRFLSSMLGTAETGFGTLYRGRQPDFWFTRREEKERWFALIGFIGSDHSMADGSPADGEVFRIGAGTRYAPKRSGYLYCFANDAWQIYDNNRGAVALTVGLV